MYEHVIGPSENLLQHVAGKSANCCNPQRIAQHRLKDLTQLVSPTVTIDCLPTAWLKYEKLDHF